MKGQDYFGISILLALQFLVVKISFSQGCHIDIIECDYEYEYAESTESPEVDNSTDYPELVVHRRNCRTVGSRHTRSTRDFVEEYFDDCMSTKIPEKKMFIPTLVEFMMYHTIWYRQADSDYCASDTVECWRTYCGYYMKWQSRYLNPVKKCIEEFGTSRGRNFSVDQDMKPYIPMPLEGNDWRLNEDFFLSYMHYHLPENDYANKIHWKELIKFYKDDFICGLNFCDCTGLPLAQHENCGDNWLTRLVGSVETTSKYRQPLLRAASSYPHLTRF